MCLLSLGIHRHKMEKSKRKFTFSKADASVDFMVVSCADPGIFASGEGGGGGGVS